MTKARRRELLAELTLLTNAASSQVIKLLADELQHVATGDGDRADYTRALTLMAHRLRLVAAAIPEVRA
jgi:hypothetical protein